MSRRQSHRASRLATDTDVYISLRLVREKEANDAGCHVEVTLYRNSEIIGTRLSVISHKDLEDGLAMWNERDGNQRFNKMLSSAQWW